MTEEAKKETNLVSAFGHFWRRDLVEWALSSKNPRMFGYNGQADDTYPEFNCARQTGIYVLHAPDREIIYVGQAFGKGGIYSRLANHNVGRFHDRWTHFSWFGFQPFVEELEDGGDAESSHVFKHDLWRKTADEETVSLKVPISLVDNNFNSTKRWTTSQDVGSWLEAIMIHLIEPSQNRRGGDWKEIEELFQWWEDEVDQTNADLYREIQSLRDEISELKTLSKR